MNAPPFPPFPQNFTESFWTSGSQGTSSKFSDLPVRLKLNLFTSLSLAESGWRLIWLRLLDSGLSLWALSSGWTLDSATCDNISRRRICKPRRFLRGYQWPVDDIFPVDNNHDGTSWSNGRYGLQHSRWISHGSWFLVPPYLASGLTVIPRLRGYPRLLGAGYSPMRIV